jgi:hypothetical protein
MGRCVHCEAERIDGVPHTAEACVKRLKELLKPWKRFKNAKDVNQYIESLEGRIAELTRLLEEILEGLRASLGKAEKTLSTRNTPSQSGGPFIGYSQNTLNTLKTVKAGDDFPCPDCGNSHPLERAKSKDGSPPIIELLYYRCGTKPYIAAVDGKCIAFKKPDVSGRV